MFERLKSMFKAPRPAGPPETIRAFDSDDETIARDVVTPDDGGWRNTVDGARSVSLLEVPMAPEPERCMLIYRARMRAEDLDGQAYLEMWCRISGMGSFSSKGLHNALTGTTGWTERETPFYLKPGQHPDLAQLNLFAEGTGRVWIKDVTLLRTPLA